ncbi:MAG: tetratricopeptide repeat protein [Myxococcales bacterium]|nr:tetratricopeptide repeat protein [Myxococcales bacterium]
MLRIARSSLAPALLTSALLVGCGGGRSEAPAAAAKSASAEVPTAPTTAAPEVAAPEVAAPEVAAPEKPRPSAKERAMAGFDADAARAQAAAFREHLAAGRKAVKAKRYAEGISALEAALKIDPNHPAALAELGWASYLAGDLGKAERFTRQAIGAATEDRTRGAALYNLGRIHEDRGERDEAATAYKRSIALRPNDTVSARLAALESAGATIGGHECDFQPHEGRPLPDLCAATVVGLAPNDLYTENHCVPGESATRIAVELPGGIKVATFRVERWMEAGGATTEVHLALLLADRWYSAVLGEEYNPGVGYIGESLVIDSIVLEDVVAGGSPEVVITFTWSHNDGDYGDNVMESEDRRIVSVLAVDGNAPRWIGAFIASSVHEVGSMIEGEESGASPSRSEKRVDHRFADGAVELSAAPGMEASSPVGRFELGALPAACPAGLPYVVG